MPIKNFYSANTAKPGDIFLVIIKAVVQYNGTYRLYRCPVDELYEPDGDRVNGRDYWDLHTDDEDIEPCSSEQIVAESIFPVLRTTKGPDLYG
jgi:hypothetical protein